jgi:hypothetical protein
MIRHSHPLMKYRTHLTDALHHVLLVKRTEASFGVVSFGGFITNSIVKSKPPFMSKITNEA